MIRHIAKLPSACRKHTVLAALALLAVLGLGGAASAPYLWANYHYRQACMALERRDLGRARAHLTLGLKARPGSADLHFLLARTERLAGDDEEAVRHLNCCQEILGPTEAVEIERLLLRVQHGDLSGAEAVLLPRLARDDPDTELILEALAHGYLKAYRWGDALGCLARLLAHQPDHAQALLWHGQIMQQLGLLKEAAADYRRAVELNPQDSWSRLCLGETLLNLKQPQRAAEHFEYLSERLEGNPAVQLGLARCRRGQGRLEEAAKLLDRLSTLYTEEGLVWTERGQLALEEGRLAEAEDCLRRAVRLRPHDRQATYALYQCLEQRGRRDEAKTWQARLEQIQRDRKHLTELIEQLLDKPNALPQRCEAGLLCLRLGEEEAARGWLESALRQDPRYTAAHQGLAEYYQHIGNAAAAARHRQLAAALERSRATESPQPPADLDRR